MKRTLEAGSKKNALEELLRNLPRNSQGTPKEKTPKEDS